MDTAPVPGSPSADTLNASSQYYGSTDSNAPYSLRNHKIPPYSTTTMKNQKKKENKVDDKDTFETLLPPTHPVLIPPMISPNTLAPLTPIPHIR